MIRGRSPLGFLFLLFLPFFCVAVHAKTPEVNFTRGQGPADIEADELLYEREGQIFQAHGRVVISRGDFSLKADHARMNRVTEEISAWGNVVLREGEDVLECERLEVNLATRTGKVYQATLFLKDQNYHITGREAEKLGENRYRIRDGSFTTCDASRPPWKFTAKELEVTVAGHGIVKKPVFYIEDIPVLYLPAAVFPILKERQTGFLFPELGYSDEFGPKVKTAFYWAMTKDMDATFYLDRLGDRGFKEGLEYRYAFTKESQGKADFYFIDDQDFDRNRYAFFLRNQQGLPNDFYLKGNINYVSDRLYLRDFEDDLPDEGATINARSQSQLRSTLWGGKNWDRFNLLAEGTYFQDLTHTVNPAAPPDDNPLDDLTQEDNRKTLQILPRVRFAVQSQALFGTPVFLEMDSSYTYFSREEGIEAQRFDLLPRVSLPMRLLNTLKVEPHLTGRETYYVPYNDPTGTATALTDPTIAPAKPFDDPESREIFEAGIDVGAELYRVYERGKFPWLSDVFQVAKWMHTIEPKISYQFIPPVNQTRLKNRSGFPLFDEVDQIPATSQITYGINQRFVGKPVKEGVESGPREYAKLNVFQSYSLGDPFTTDREGKRRSFSDIQGELWWYFSPYVTAQTDAAFNPYDGNLTGHNASVTLKDRRNDALLVGYRYTKHDTQALNLYGRIKTIAPLYLYGAFLYNYRDKTRVENVYGFEYQDQCWSLGLNVQDIAATPDGTQERELRFQVYFSLLGVGSRGNRSSILNF